jgi:hypothetical protein
VPRPLSGVEGVDIDSRAEDRLALGGVEVSIASAPVETLRLTGVDTDVVVILLGPVVVVTCNELFCVLTCRAFPIIP